MSLKNLFLATTAVALMLPFCVMADTAKADPKSPVTHEEFSALLRETLLKDPEMIVDAVKSIRAKQQEEASKEVEKAIAKHNEDLFKDVTSPSIGDAKIADITIVEFFDYHCGYCKRMLGPITQLSKEDPKVRVIFREFPILSDDSTLAARAALAVNRIYPGKYFAFHTALMGNAGKFDDATLSGIATKEGLDWKKIKKEMDSPETGAILDKNHALAEELGVRGTPALIMGKKMLPGAVSYDELKQAIESVRTGKPIPEANPDSSHEAPKKP